MMLLKAQQFRSPAPDPTTRAVDRSPRTPLIDALALDQRSLIVSLRVRLAAAEQRLADLEDLRLQASQGASQ
jgi:myo-inositol catabolism protein IolC